MSCGVTNGFMCGQTEQRCDQVSQVKDKDHVKESRPLRVLDSCGVAVFFEWIRMRFGSFVMWSFDAM